MAHKFIVMYYRDTYVLFSGAFTMVYYIMTTDIASECFLLTLPMFVTDPHE